MRAFKDVPVVYDFEEQMRRWVEGDSVHSDHRGLGPECCPDFSCCQPHLQQPLEVRQAYLSASEEDRGNFLSAFLGGMLSDARADLRVHITDGTVRPQS